MRYIALLCGLVVGGCFSLPTAFLNGLAMGGSGYSGYAGYGIGALFVGVVGVSWFGGSWGYTLLAGRARVGGALVLAVWSVCMIFAVSMSAGFVAAHRGETGGERQNQIDAYGRAKADWERGDAEARAANAAGRAKTTERAEARLQAAKAKLDAGRRVALLDVVRLRHYSPGRASAGNLGQRSRRTGLHRGFHRMVTVASPIKRTGQDCQSRDRTGSRGGSAASHESGGAGDR